jgi:ABC-type uncharacterized transport system involved in gliding motility auxiliary subunit
MDKERLSQTLALGGLFVLVVGTVLAMSRSAPGALGVGLAAAGALCLVVAGLMNARAVLSWGRSRSARYGTNSLLMTVFFTAILVIVQAIAVQNDQQLDTTRNQRYTLAPQTIKVLGALGADVHVTAFFRLSSEQRPRAQSLLDLYARHGNRFTYEMVDPDRRPDVADEMGATYGNLVVTARDRKRVVDHVDEQALTNAVIQVTRATLKSVYFVVGHSEKALESNERTGYSSVKRGLENEGYVVHELALLDVTSVPQDCEALVVAGPAFDYIATEVDRIEEYLRHGGSALFLLEPRVSLPNIERLLEQYEIELPNVEMLDEVTVKNDDRAFGPRWTKVLDYGNHPITRHFTAATFYPGARPVRLVVDPDDLRFQAAYLAVSSKTTWGETDESSFTTGTATRDSTDVLGPLPVAAAVTRTYGTTPDTRQEARVVVFGDSDFISNANYGLLGNADLFLNCIGYLTHEEDLIEIRPKQGLHDRVYITQRQGRLIFVLCFLLLPLSVVTVGTTVFVRRRRN